MASEDLLIPVERIEEAIPLIHEEKVILDRTLSELYGVQTEQLNVQFGGKNYADLIGKTA